MSLSLSIFAAAMSPSERILTRLEVSLATTRSCTARVLAWGLMKTKAEFMRGADEGAADPPSELESFLGRIFLTAPLTPLTAPLRNAPRPITFGVRVRSTESPVCTHGAE